MEKIKTGTIYITTSKQYALQGLFKISKNLSMNNYINTEDSMVTLFEIKTYDDTLEKNIHTYLQEFRNEREFFKCPYYLLEKIVKQVVNNSNMDFETVNEIIKDVNNINSEPDSELKYVKGFDMKVFNKEQVKPEKVKIVKNSDEKLTNFIHINNNFSNPENKNDDMFKEYRDNIFF